MECKVCKGFYLGSFRDHCPNCGNIHIAQMTLHTDVAPANKLVNKFYPIVAARGCERQYPTYARVFIDFSDCDAESEFGLRF